MAALFVLLAPLSAGAEERATIQVENTDAYGRMILDFPDLYVMPEHTIRSSNGVLVLEFATEVNVDVSRVPITLSKYVTIARGDPANRGARFALARGVTVNTMEAGPKLFVDFLPQGWKGPPPRLPDEVVAELARRAEEAQKQAREAEMLRQVGGTRVKLDMRVAETPTFTRFVFDWNVPFEASLKRNGAAMSVSFNREAKPDLASLKANPPQFLNSIDVDEEATDGLTLVMGVPPTADVRAFREEGAYVVDIQGPPATGREDAVTRILDAAHGTAGPAGGRTSEVVEAHGETPAGHHADPQHAEVPPAAAASPREDHGADHGADHGDDHAAAAPSAAHGAGSPDLDALPDAVSPELPTLAVHDGAGHGEPGAAAHDAAPTAAPAQEPATAHAEDAATPAAQTPETHSAAEPAAAPVSHGEEHAAPADHAAEGHAADPQAAEGHAAEGHGATAAARPATPEVAELPEGGSVDLTDSVIHVEAKRIGRATRLVFPYKKPVGSSMFTRGASLWLVFDDGAPLGVETLQTALAGMATSIEALPIDGGQALRITLAEPLLATLNPDGTFWVITIGDMVTQPARPLQVKRSIREDGTVALEVPFGPASGVHYITDPSIGDQIVVVTAMGPPRGLTKPQTFTEVDALSSGHGLALVPKADDVSILVRDAIVSIERPEGMSVSTAVPVERASLLDLPAAMGVQASDRQGYLELGSLEAKDAPDFWVKRHELGTELTRAQNKEDRLDALYKLAEFQLANGLAFEAVGLLDLVVMGAQEEATSGRMAMMRAAANVVAERYKEAIPFLDRPDFADHPEAAVWRAIALTELGDYPAARRNFPRAEVAVGRYPAAIQNRFLLAAVKTSIELNDYGKARSLMAQIDPKTLTTNQRATVDVMSARAADASGYTSEAMELLTKAVQTARGPVEADATFRLVNLQRREGLITPDQAANRLEQLAVSWRGDDIELRTLRTLGQVSVEQGNYRRGFELMQVANLVNPEAENTRLMQEEMQAAFSSLFLDGKSNKMPAVDALALYYDFRELTPPGKRGDEMVRNLASRLVDVDLLPQAAQLLSHQVDSRLRGAAKAKVAADLALVYLLDGRPDRALMTLARTRQAELPVAIERQRRLVEARALANTGKPDIALELLKPLAGGDVDRLKAEVLWTGGRYQEAGEQFERMLGARWAEELPLDDREQNDVLRAGVAYTLAEDQIALDRLRAKFDGKMATTKNAAAFGVVTGPIDGTGAEFAQIAQTVVTADAMKSFLEEYRRRYLNEQMDDKPRLVEQPIPDDMKSLEVPGIELPLPGPAAHGTDGHTPASSADAAPLHAPAAHAG